MNGDSQQKTVKPKRVIAIRLVSQPNEEENYDDLTTFEKNLISRRESPSVQVDVEVDFSDEGEEMRPGVRLVEPSGKRDWIKEIVGGVVAIILVILVFLRSGVSEATGLTILLAILAYYFGKKFGQHR
jgi:hypothetical protein